MPGPAPRPPRPRAAASVSLFYAASFATLGLYLPYFNLYLDRLRFGSLQIGVVSALLPLCGALVPAASGWAADRMGRRRLLVIASSAGAFAAFLPIFAARGFAAVAVVIGLFALCRAPALPIVEASAVEIAGSGGPPYGVMRAWGSFAFIAAALSAAPLLGRFGETSVLWLLVLVLGAGAAVAFLLPDDRPRGPSTGRAPAGARGVLKKKEVILFLAACILSQASHGPYYVFFSLHLREAGVPAITLGLLWATAVGFEILMMLRMPAVLGRLGAERTMTLCLALAAVRWCLCAATVSPPALIVAQALHAATFAAFHVAAVTHTFALFGRERSATGQAIYSSATYGVGNLVGMVGSGLLRDPLGGTRALFAIGAAIACLGALLMAWSARLSRLPSKSQLT